MKLHFAAFALMGVANATSGQRKCGAIEKCYLVNLETNGERNVFNAIGTEIPQDGASALNFDPTDSSKGWTIKCELTAETIASEEKKIDYVKYYFGEDQINTHYSAPFYINGDGSGTWLNKFEYLTEATTCGAIDIEVKSFTWEGGRDDPCDSFTLKLQGPPCPTSPPTKSPTDAPTKSPTKAPTSLRPTRSPTKAPVPTPAPACPLPPPLSRCHLCRNCKSIRAWTSGTFPNPFPGKLELQVVRRGGRVTVSTELPTIRYRHGKTYADAHWWGYPQKAREVADGSVYVRGVNDCGAAVWRKCSVGSPIALDLDRSNAVEHIVGNFDFDLSGNGIPEELTEWFAPTEGILVDSTYPGFASGDLIGWHLYGDLGGLHDDGFDKLALHDFNGDGIVSGADELEGIAIWTDANSNAKMDEGELSTLEDHSIVSLYLSHDDNYISKAIVDTGDEEYEMMTQDLWFAR